MKLRGARSLQATFLLSACCIPMGGERMPREGLQLQAARVLDTIRTLEDQYGGLILQQDPRLSEALKDVADALERYVNGTGTEGEESADTS
jgi:hypothetical protein